MPEPPYAVIGESSDGLHRHLRIEAVMDDEDAIELFDEIRELVQEEVGYIEG